MDRFILAIMLILASMSSVNAAPELKGNPEELRSLLHPIRNTVILSAESKKTAYSDMAKVNLIVTTENKLLSISLQENQRIRDETGRMLATNGIAPSDIKNSKFSSTPQYGWLGKKPSSYKVVNRIAVSISATSHLQAIAEIADQSDAIRLSSTQFEHSKKATFEVSVKEEALAKIQDQRHFYETKLGIKLIPIGIRESNIYDEATFGASMIEEVIVTASISESSQSRGYNNLKTSPVTPSFDEIQYSAKLSVIFSVSDALNSEL